MLNLDDQISTGLHPHVWDRCQRLADATRRWWSDLDAIVYRSRTSPATSVNFAFFSSEAFATEASALADAESMLTDIVLHEGFTLGWDV